jgi:transcriptional regulator with XRE-family HTH domain
MKPHDPGTPAGTQLRLKRKSLGLKMRDVESLSADIAEKRGNSDFVLSRSWLADLENETGHLPSLPKLYSLSSIYKMRWTDMAKIFGVPIQDLGKDQASYGAPRTHLLPEPEDDDEQLTLPLRLRNDPEVQQTNLLYKLAAIWGGVPISLLRQLNPDNCLYGFIGLSDYTLSPLLRPGTFVEIDVNQRKIMPAPPHSEGPFDRPIYFLELREEFACGWCEMKGDRLFLLAHPNSGRETRQFLHPQEAEIVGRVTGIAMGIDKDAERRRLGR